MFSLQEFFKIWNNFFFEPQSACVLGLFRIFIGLLCVAEVYSLYGRAEDYLGPEGFFSYRSWQDSYRKKLHFSFFHCLPDNIYSVYLILCGMLISSICLCLGFHTELAAIFTYLFWTSITHRNVHIFNSGDSLLRIILFLLIFSGCGYGVSIDNHINGRDQFYTMVNPWIWRLMQFLLLNIYLQSAYEKINNGTDWRNGTAFYYALNNNFVNRCSLGKYINKTISALCGGAVLMLEFFAPIGLYFKETNVLCIIVLTILNIGFETMLRIGMFGVKMIILLILFIDPVWGANFISSNCIQIVEFFKTNLL